MHLRRAVTVACYALLTATAVAGCGDDSSGGISVDEVRTLATDVGDSPTACPLDIDPADAEFVSAETSVSEADEPAADPVVAQRDEGLSPIEAAAGAEIACTYTIDGDELEIRVMATRGDGAAALYLPLVMADAKLSSADLNSFVDDLPEPGDVAVAGDTVALGRLHVDGDGDAAIFATGGGLDGDDLKDLANDLGDQLTD